MNINQAQDKIIEEMSTLDDWMEKYQYIIDLGKSMKPFDPAYKTEENAIAGCQSKVWLYGELKDGRMFYNGESEASITKGIAGLLLKVLDNKAPEEIINSELYFLQESGLNTSLSPSRANGLGSMLKRIIDLAREKVS